MSSREEKMAAELDEFADELVIPTDANAEDARIAEANRYVRVPGDPIVSDDMDLFATADFEGDCAYGDLIRAGDTIRPCGMYSFEHLECVKEGGPVFQDRYNLPIGQLYEGELPVSDLELPGMWERADFE